MTYPAAAGLAEALQTKLATVTYRTEDDLQAAISAAIVWKHQREVRLSDGISRVDLFIPTGGIVAIPNLGSFVCGVGVEVKIASSLPAVIRQLDRYAACPEIDDLILITTRSKHHRTPRLIGARGIRVHLVSLVRNGL